MTLVHPVSSYPAHFPFYSSFSTVFPNKNRKPSRSLPHQFPGNNPGIEAGMFVGVNVERVLLWYSLQKEKNTHPFIYSLRCEFYTALSLSASFICLKNITNPWGNSMIFIFSVNFLLDVFFSFFKSRAMWEVWPSRHEGVLSVPARLLFGNGEKPRDNIYSCT